MTCVFLLVAFALGFFVRSLRDDLPEQKRPALTVEEIMHKYHHRADD